MAKVIKTEIELNETTKAIVSNIANVGKEIQNHLVDLMISISATRNTAPAERFLSGVMLLSANKDGSKPKMQSIVRATAIKFWLETYGFCSYGKSKKTGKFGMQLNGKGTNGLDTMTQDQLGEHFKIAAKAIWNKITPEKAFMVFDLDARLTATLKAAKEALEATDMPEGKTHKVNADRLAKLEELVKAIAA